MTTEYCGEECDMGVLGWDEESLVPYFLQGDQL